MRGLLVIDVQNSFAQRPNWATVSRPDIAERADHLVRAFREAGEPVYWVLHSEPNSGTVFDPAVNDLTFLPPLAPQGTEPVVTKTSRNAFTTTNLQQRLTVDGVDTVVICGIQTEQCCETTARLAADLGYSVEFVLDATATFPVRHHQSDPDAPHETQRWLLPPEIMERTEYALAGRFATITSVSKYGVPQHAPVPH